MDYGVERCQALRIVYSGPAQHQSIAQVTDKLFLLACFF
jgi:hypothetical protein